MLLRGDGGCRIGIMGGTFDPIHNGHLVAAETARYEFGLEKVFFIPSGCPPHKRKRQVSSAFDRCRMTALAIAGNPGFVLSDVEMRREGFSYTVDTLKFFLDIYPEAQICFITGTDAVLELLTWHNAGQLFELCHFIAASRPGYDLSGKISGWPEQQRLGISELSVPALEISSTNIRRRVREGKPIKYLLPAEVENYIYRHRLYV